MNQRRTSEKSVNSNKIKWQQKKSTAEKRKQVWDITEKIITKNERKRIKKKIDEKEGRKVRLDRYLDPLSTYDSGIDLIEQEQEQRQRQDHPSPPVLDNVQYSTFRAGYGILDGARLPSRRKANLQGEREERKKAKVSERVK